MEDLYKMATEIGVSRDFIGEPFNPRDFYTNWRDVSLDLKLGLLYGYEATIKLGYDAWGR